MLYTKQKAFTLVELIVVVTILAILATIGFVSYSSYLIGVRDTNRIAQITSLSDGLNLYSTRNDLPIPEDNVEILVGTDNLIAYQGYAGANILETINFDKGGVDPRDNTYFSYYLTRNRKYFQLMGFLEESADLTTLNRSPLLRGIKGDTTHAVNLQDRIPTVTGKKLGIMTNDQNEPVQDAGQDLDLSNTGTDVYKAYLKNDNILEGSGSVFQNLAASAILGGKINFAPTGEIMFEAKGNWNYIDESSTCIDEELFSAEKLVDIQKIFDAGYSNISIDSDLTLRYQGDDSVPKHFVYAKKISNLNDFDMHLNEHAGNNTRMILDSSDKSLMRCTLANTGLCGTNNLPSNGTDSEPLFIYRINLQPNCDGATAFDDGLGRNRFTFDGTYYRILMQ